MNGARQMNHVTAVARNGDRHGGGGVQVPAESQIPPRDACCTSSSNPPQPYPRPRRVLWKKQGDNNDDDDGFSFSCIQDLEERYLMRPKPKSIWEIANNAIVVAQEFSLSCYFLLRYRLFLLEEEEEKDLLQLQRISSQDRFSSSANGTLLLLQQAQAQRQSYIDFSTLAMSTALMLVVYFGSQMSSNHHHQQQQSRKHKVRQRLSDALLLAALLRLLAGVLRTLTASYASDTVTSLVHYGMIIHLLFCDYDYANGKSTTSNTAMMVATTTSSTPLTTAATATATSHHHHHHRRPPFQGGTLSLNAAFFATVVAISRLESNMTAYLLCSLAVIIFAFYPASRHAISVQCQEHATTTVGTAASASASAPVEPSRSSRLTLWSRKASVYAHWIISTFVIVAVVGLIMALETTTATASSHGYRLISWFGGIWLSLVLILPAWKALVLQRFKKVMRPGCPWDIPTAASMQIHHRDANIS